MARGTWKSSSSARIETEETTSPNMIGPRVDDGIRTRDIQIHNLVP